MEIKLEPQEIEAVLKQYIQSKFNSHITIGRIQTADHEGYCCDDGVSNTYYIQVHTEPQQPTPTPTAYRK